MASWNRIFLDYWWYWREALVTLLIVAGAWLASNFYIVIIDKVVRRWTQKTPSTLDDEILEVIRKPGELLILLAGIYGALHRYSFRLLGFADGVLFVVGVSVAIWTVIRIAGVLLTWYGERISRERDGETVVREFLPFFDRIMKIVISAIGLVMILDRFGIEIKSILVTLGIGSLAVGLALQDTLANMFGGFTIMLDRPFRVGHRIQLQSGEMGDVQEIGMRSTSVLMPDGNLLIIPNSLLVKTIVINHSFPDSRSQIKIEVGIAYGSDVERAKELMLEEVRRHPEILERPAPAAYLISFGDSALKMVLVCHVKSYVDLMRVRDSLNTGIGKKFKQHGIDIPFPAHTVYLHNDRAAD